MIWISETPFVAEDLEKIEKEMKKIVKEDLDNHTDLRSQEMRLSLISKKRMSLTK